MEEDFESHDLVSIRKFNPAACCRKSEFILKDRIIILVRFDLEFPLIFHRLEITAKIKVIYLLSEEEFSIIQRQCWVMCNMHSNFPDKALSTFKGYHRRSGLMI